MGGGRREGWLCKSKQKNQSLGNDTGNPESKYRRLRGSFEKVNTFTLWVLWLLSPAPWWSNFFKSSSSFPHSCTDPTSENTTTSSSSSDKITRLSTFIELKRNISKQPEHETATESVQTPWEKISSRKGNRGTGRLCDYSESRWVGESFAMWFMIEALIFHYRSQLKLVSLPLPWSWWHPILYSVFPSKL